MNRLVSKDVSDNIIASSVMALSSMQNMSTKLLSYKDANNVTVGFTGCLIPVKMGDYWGLIDTATDVHRTTDLDTGSIAAATAYYVYSVTNGSAISFKTSVSSSAPTGYSTSTSELLGGFTTDGSSNIDSATVWDVKTKIHNLILATPDIDGGTVDGATIATSNITVGAGKTLDVSAGTLTLADNQISGDKVEGGTIAAITITALTTTTQADNNSSTLPATTAYTKSQDAVLAREPNQGVALTASASVTGIQVADNANIDMGTNNFTLVWKGILPDWTPSALVNLIRKKVAGGDGYLFYITTAGKLSCYLNDAYDYTVTTAPSFVDGSVHELTAVITRGTSIGFYVDGVLYETVAATTSTLTVSNAESLYVLGNDTTRYAGTVHHAYTFNRALSAAEVLDLYRNGIAERDKWGSQTPKYTSDFSAGVDSWTVGEKVTLTGNIDGIGGLDDNLRITIDGNSGYHRTRMIGSTLGSISSSKKARHEFYYYIPSTNSVVTGIAVDTDSDTSKILSTHDAWTFYSFEKNFAGSTIIGDIYLVAGTSFSFQDVGGDDVVYIRATNSYEIGATLALEPEGIQPAPGQCLDSSSNKLHAMQPATGSSLTRYKKTGEIRWTNTWAGTHEAQYIGGINQAILPANCYIESIVGVVSGATIEDIIVGDGSDTDRWVEITTGLAAGTYSFAIANRISDGTNYKMVVDPDANFTGSIIWTIKYSILEA